MATIETRTTPDGKISYRVKIRIRGFPAQSATFERKTDAKLKQHKLIPIPIQLRIN